MESEWSGGVVRVQSTESKEVLVVQRAESGWVRGVGSRWFRGVGSGNGQVGSEGGVRICSGWLRGRSQGVVRVQSPGMSGWSVRLQQLIDKNRLSN